MPQFSLCPIFQHVSPQTILISQMSSTRLINANDFQLLLICSLFHFDCIFSFLNLFFPSPPLYAKVHQGPLVSEFHSSEANCLPEPTWGVPRWPAFTFVAHVCSGLISLCSQSLAHTCPRRHTHSQICLQLNIHDTDIIQGFPTNRWPAWSVQAGVPGLGGRRTLAAHYHTMGDRRPGGGD